MLELLQTALQQLTHWLSPYYSEIALTLVATLLVIYGDVINKHIKRALNPYHFVIRTAVFVLICAFGYGLLIVWLSPFVKQTLLCIPALYRGLTIVLIFLLMGYLAENRRYI
jgi:cell division protein FtsW (lipid II flippase)